MADRKQPESSHALQRSLHASAEMSSKEGRQEEMYHKNKEAGEEAKESDGVDRAKEEQKVGEEHKAGNEPEMPEEASGDDAAELFMGMESFRGASLPFTPDRPRVEDEMLSRTGAKRSQTWRRSGETSPDPHALQPTYLTATKVLPGTATSSANRSRVWFWTDTQPGSGSEHADSELLQADDEVQQDLFKDTGGEATKEIQTSRVEEAKFQPRNRNIARLARQDVETDLMEFCGMSPISLSMRSISSPLSVFPSTTKKFAGGAAAEEPSHTNAR
eukprot:750671-Hanusia_phi.AAC.2